MTDKPKPTVKQKLYTQLETMIIRSAVMVIVAVLGFVFIEPVRENAAAFANLPDDLAAYKQETNDRFDHLESIVDTPAVVEWNVIRQQGDCDSELCKFYIAFNRTEFGKDCGVPVVQVQVRIDGGVPVWTEFRDFTPIEGQTSGSSAFVDLVLEQDLILGHKDSIEFRVTNTYPTCLFPRQPVTKRSPWWKITPSRR